MIFGREPALITGFIKSLLATAVAVGILDWNSQQIASVHAAAAALLGLYVAWATKDTFASAVLGFVDAVLALLAGFGLNLDANKTAAIIGLVTVVIAMFNRTQTSPAKPAERGFNTADFAAPSA